MSSVTSVTIALALAAEMAKSHQPNDDSATGAWRSDALQQAESPIPAPDITAVWVSGMPETVAFPDMLAWDMNTTPGNQTTLVDANAIGCSLAYLSLCCKHGMDLNDIASQVQQDNYLVLASMPNAPTWDEFIQAMRDAGWPPSNDPCGAWLSQ